MLNVCKVLSTTPGTWSALNASQCLCQNRRNFGSCLSPTTGELCGISTDLINKNEKLSKVCFSSHVFLGLGCQARKMVVEYINKVREEFFI